MKSTLVMVPGLALSLAALTPGLAMARQIHAYRPGAGVSFPVLLREVTPRYTPEALQARIAGEVEVEAVVQADGTVSDVRVMKSLDRVYGLDAAAVAAAQKWLFKPGFKDGAAVPTIVRIVLGYRLPTGPGAPATVAVSPLQAAADEFTANTVPEDTPRLQKPTVTLSVAAKYTPEAMRAKIQGTVDVQAVVLPDGTVGRARITRSLDPNLGLDQQALDAVKQWQFMPGTLDGEAVAVLITVIIEFKMH